MARFVFFLAIAFFPIATSAQTYPAYDELFVNDFADLLDSDQEDAIRTELQELREATGIEFTVVTIANMSDYGHEGPIEPFATGLFNDWGVGSAETNDGLMMLVARYDRVMRIEVGAGYGRSQDAAMKSIIEEDILPHFRNDDYARGIDTGVDEVIYQITGTWPGEFDTSTAQKWVSRIWRFIEGLGNWLWAGAAGIAGLAVQAWRRWQRNKPRNCPIDQRQMTRLDEDWDDNHLQQGQILEETLKSVDYDVWHCDKCGHVTVEAYKAWFSRYGACRQCGFRTVEGDETILRSATTSSSGLKRIDYSCHHCGDAYSVERVIPRKSKSSSGSSSFGGGRSSGGGASGSW
ncbi:TPM domain-containing protein [Thalassococcus sp. BH17M4-6]|uniref:TPM domain-containing protein n=1 Tax=Thalassococcus sp. BH17M4-6 TaxID=3413148 RepID=UPI003BBF2E52